MIPNLQSPQASALPRDLSRDAWGRLVLVDAAGETHVGVHPIRAFPFTDPERWVMLCDSQGKELACLRDPAELPAPLQQVLREEIARREFVPTIVEIRHVSGISEPCEWDVVTDRGGTVFVLNSEDDVRRLGPHRALITDAQGVRYHIPDARQLNAAGRKVIERYL